MKSKNILLITTDQQSATMLSCTGNPDLHTPHMDALAEDGIRFEKAYAAQPLCIPQRNSWYTGRMPHEHGLVFNLRDITAKGDPMMGKVFKDAGYITGYSGKWHICVDPNDTERHGFEWTSNLRSNGADAGIVPDFERFLEDKREGPFLFSASFNNPHNICEAARGAELPDGHPVMFENVDDLPELPENFEIPVGEPSVLREVQKKLSDSNYPTQKWDTIRWRIHRWQYARMVEMVDAYVGQLLNLLQEKSLMEDTLIVFASDHGDGNAHHRWNQKQTFYDESARVPFIVCQPGSALKEVNHSQLVNTGIDLIPTLCGLAGIACPAHFEGKDWSGLLSDPDRDPGRDYIVMETEMGSYGNPFGVLGRAIRTSGYKYVVYNTGENREFFTDMVNDPGEMVNVVDHPDHQKALEVHRELLRQEIQRSGDIFPTEMVGSMEANGCV